MQSWIETFFSFKFKIITFEKVKFKFINTLRADLKFYLFFIYSHFYPLNTRKQRGAIQARLEVVDHFVYQTWMGESRLVPFPTAQ